MFVDPPSESVFVELLCPHCNFFSACEIDYQKAQKDVFICPKCRKKYNLIGINMKPMLAIVAENSNGKV